jgi:hypothetical protein
MQRNKHHAPGVMGIPAHPGCKGQDTPAIVKLVVQIILVPEESEFYSLWVDFLVSCIRGWM